ncbi:hypothetical protein GCM10008096_15200 [Zhihengliuella salsuginis]|uniref:DUF6318 domain-containing protein n=2 Tax=Zhihengliuella salsuginis TaxID=578222 RepID=A0ABQ3GJ05_9MICC|nr:hypothetical protein GCM10008096_15200 [Zhihengliuella salsuginis]
MPEEAKEFSADGYEAFVEYWFEAHDYGMQSGDTTSLDDVSNEGCGFCLSRIDDIDGVNSGAQWVFGGELIADDISASMVEDDQGLYAATFTMRQVPGSVYSYDAAENEVTVVEEIVESERALLFFAFYDESNGWDAAAVVEDSAVEEESS